MANAKYDFGRESFANGDVDWLVDTIRVALLSSAYTFDQTDQFFSELSGVVGTPATLAGKTTTGGACDADDVLFTGLTGSTVVACVVYKWTGVAGTSVLLKYFDTGAGLPFVPDGVKPFRIIWSDGTAKIMKV